MDWAVPTCQAPVSALTTTDLVHCSYQVCGKGLFFLKNFIYLLFFRERGREGEREAEKYQCVRETSIGCLLHTPPLGTWSATQACAVIGNRTSNLLVCRLVLSPLSHTTQGWKSFLFNYWHVINILFVYVCTCIKHSSLFTNVYIHTLAF